MRNVGKLAIKVEGKGVVFDSDCLPLESAFRISSMISNANFDAVMGTYTPGSCPSVGTDGNVKQAAGPY